MNLGLAPIPEIFSNKPYGCITAAGFSVDESSKDLYNAVTDYITYKASIS